MFEFKVYDIVAFLCTTLQEEEEEEEVAVVEKEPVEEQTTPVVKREPKSYTELEPKSMKVRHL